MHISNTIKNTGSKLLDYLGPKNVDAMPMYLEKIFSNYVNKNNYKFKFKLKSLCKFMIVNSKLT